MDLGELLRNPFVRGLVGLAASVLLALIASAVWGANDDARGPTDTGLD